MPRHLSLFSFVGLASLVALSPLGRSETAPAGTVLDVRLKSAVSCSSQSGQKVDAVVIAPVSVNGQIVIPSGVTITGKVKSAYAPKAADQRSKLQLEFTQLIDYKGIKVQISTKTLAVDNARESVDDTGQILGILESETLGSQMDRGIEQMADGPLAKLAGLLKVAKGAVIRDVNPQIHYEPGVELRLTLTKEANLKGDFPSPDVALIEPADSLYEFVNKLPFQTFTPKPSKPSDITNIMYIGAKEKVQQIFTEAGWATAESLNAQSGLETVRAVVENRGYKEAPMSTLVLENKPPEMVYQKQLNTFAKRHHLRIFARPEKFQGLDVWVCAATHDIGIAFSPENRTFIHKIDSKIDVERAKVVSDLLHTGKVKALALVERPAVPKSSQNATGDKLETDGAMAVLQLQ
jgi:hypothetical protein